MAHISGVSSVEADPDSAIPGGGLLGHNHYHIGIILR